MSLEQLKEKLIEIYGDNDREIRYFSSPGRVNLIGEHIDYNGGHVFPSALSLTSTIAIRKREDRVIRILATDLNYVVEANLDELELYKELKWGNYQLAIADELIKAGYNISGCEIIYEDKVPLGSGLSSSAAIEIVTAIGLLSINGYTMDKVDIAKLAQKAEHNYVGVKCGIMDQFASILGKKNMAVLLNCKTLEYEHIPLKMDGYKIVIANTNKKRSLGESKYNERRAQCESALEDLKSEYRDIEFLCDLTYTEFLKSKILIKEDINSKRAMHVIRENERVIKAVNALKDGNISLFGQYMIESHNSLRDLYEVSCIELDTLVDVALLQDGVLGARMTGAGFGGCTVNIVREKDIDKFIKNVSKVYKSKIGYEASFYISEISDGGKEVYI